MTVPRLVPVARLTVELLPPLVIGDGGAGSREVIPIAGGTVAGPRLAGRVLPGGADWALTRRDGVAEIWARYTIATADGALIMVTNGGLAQQAADGTWRGRTAPVFEVAAEPYRWLSRSLFIGTLLAAAAGDRVALEWWQVE